MIVIDRIEDSVAYLEIGGEMVSISSAELPEGAKEGDILSFCIMDSSAIKQAGADRLARLTAASDLGDCFDL